MYDIRGYKNRRVRFLGVFQFIRRVVRWMILFLLFCLLLSNVYLLSNGHHCQTPTRRPGAWRLQRDCRELGGSRRDDDCRSKWRALSSLLVQYERNVAENPQLPGEEIFAYRFCRRKWWRKPIPILNKHGWISNKQAARSLSRGPSTEKYPTSIQIEARSIRIYVLWGEASLEVELWSHASRCLNEWRASSASRLRTTSTKRSASSTATSTTTSLFVPKDALYTAFALSMEAEAYVANVSFVLASNNVLCLEAEDSDVVQLVNILWQKLGPACTVCNW